MALENLVIRKVKYNTIIVVGKIKDRKGKTLNMIEICILGE